MLKKLVDEIKRRKITKIYKEKSVLMLKKNEWKFFYCGKNGKHVLVFFFKRQFVFVRRILMKLFFFFRLSWQGNQWRLHITHWAFLLVFFFLQMSSEAPMRKEEEQRKINKTQFEANLKKKEKNINTKKHWEVTMSCHVLLLLW